MFELTRRLKYTGQRHTSLLIMHSCPLSVGLHRRYFYFESGLLRWRQGSPHVAVRRGLFWRTCRWDRPACIYINNNILLMGLGDEDSDAGLTSEALSWWVQPNLSRRKYLSITIQLLFNKQPFSSISHELVWKIIKA